MLNKNKTMNQITEITLSTGKWLFVRIPDQAYPTTVGTDNTGVDRLWYGLPIVRGMFSIELPKGHTYTLIGQGSKLSEEQCLWIVFKDNKVSSLKYDRQFWKEDLVGFSTASEALLALLKAHGLSADTTVIIRVND